jgi:hypothetical protein
MKRFQLAQLNIARMNAPIDSPVMSDLVANLTRINTLAEHARGYVWRLKTEDNNATALVRIGDSALIARKRSGGQPSVTVRRR